MKHAMLLATFVAGALSLTGCSHTVPANGASRATASVLPLRDAKWTASVQSVNQSRFGATDSTRDKSYGSAEWTRGDGPGLSTVNLAFTYTGPEHDLSWAILFGRCGSASLPLIPISNFPELEVAGGGRTQVTATLPLEFPTSGAYRVDIYKDRLGGAQSVVACGNLKYVSG